ncbi:hypothetical protein IQ07DRAFT_617715 [Pyrenochaeta sp. DS3sAY3a]|nr:hypothetical protein IQ07DRAFT_617715 [Pyrenochaeta sp. DS3sAY3a]
MKLATACSECRLTKRKCAQDPADPDAACFACQTRGIECSKPWANPKHLTRWQVPLLHIAPAAQNRGLIASSEAIKDFVRLYFLYIHDRPHSLFHEPTLWAALEDGTLPESLIAAICALGCRFSANIGQRELTNLFVSRSKSMLGQNLEDMSIVNIQTCILLANSYAAEQNNRLEALYFGIANRMAYVLRLHQTDHTDAPILREIKLRVWWSLFMADKWCPPGLGLPREILKSDPSLDLPMDEVDFQTLHITECSSLSERSSGIWAYKTTLADILASIQDVNLSLVHGHNDRQIVDLEVASIAARLTAWHETLPRHMVMNDENFEAHRAEGQGGTFVALHFGYHHYSTLLYFQYLEPDQEPDEKTSFRLLDRARRSGNCHVVYFTVAHMTIVSSSVLLHMLLFGGNAEVEVARLQLTRNFEALEALTRYWPGVEQLKERLFVFQDACLRSTAARAYAVDRWIVRFLLEYALPIAISQERRAFLGKALEDVRS